MSKLSNTVGPAEAFRVRLLHLLARHVFPSRARVILHRWRGVNVCRGVFIGVDVHIDDDGPDRITIQNNAWVSAGAMLLTHMRDLSHYRRGVSIGDCDYVKRPIVVGEGAHIGMRAIILPGVTIGKGAIIGAGSVVTKDVPDYCVAAGVPARVIRQIPEADAENPSSRPDGIEAQQGA